MTQTPTLEDHPFFTEGAVWSAIGHYVEEGGRVLPAVGTYRLRRATAADARLGNGFSGLSSAIVTSSSVVSYDEADGEGEDGDDAALWRLDVDLRLVLVQGEHTAWQAVMLIDPPDNQGRDAFWTWHSMTMGDVMGHFTAVGDSFLNQAFSDDGRFGLAECFLLAEEDGVYLVRGAVSRDGETIGAWALELSLVE